jgi:hypothetical protein
MNNRIENRQRNQDGSIVSNLNFIKLNKRYPWTTKLTMPIVVYGIVFLLTACLSLTLLNHNSDGNPTKISGKIILPLGSLLVLGFTISIYLKSLKFIVLPTGLSKQLNHDLLVSFLNQKHLLIYYHPETTDVIQIVSRPLNFQDDRREALVFVIDENAILINSHFTDSGWRLTAASRHDKQIGGELMQWMLQYKNQNEKAVR